MRAGMNVASARQAGARARRSPRRRLALAVLASGLALFVTAALSATARAAWDARLDGSFAMNGRITFAEDVYGEHTGGRVHRTWTFFPHCAVGVGVCKRVTVVRQRSGRLKLDVLVLKRVSPGVYVGHGRFWVALRCAGRVERHGGLATEKITVRITQTQMVGKTPSATGLSASYENPSRTNLTRCPGGIGHDAASYAGRLTSPLPGPPTASFAATPDLVTMTASFTDQSRPGIRDTRIVAWAWTFGDPLSPDDSSTQRNPTHRFSSPGTYTVTLTVRDEYGLTATVSQQVTV
jgi:hypothetical protein